MNDTTATMHVIKSYKDLLGNLLDEMHGNTLILVTFDETQKVFAEHFEHHANVHTVRTFMAEMIKERDYVRPARVRL